MDTGLSKDTRTIVDALRQRATGEPDTRASAFLLDGEREEVHFTYADLDRRARAIAALLQSMTTPGERALLLYPPGLDYLAAFLGCQYAGIVAVPAYPPDPLRLERTLPRLFGVIADSRAALALCPSFVQGMSASLLAGNASAVPLRWLATDTLPEGVEHAYCEHNPAPGDLAFLQYTSGSTGNPRGVMLSHENLVRNLDSIAQAFQITRRDRCVSWLPPYHDMGLIGASLGPLYFGIPVAFMSPLHFLQRPLRWLQAVSRFRATVTGGPNFAYELAVHKTTQEQRAELDLSCVEVAFCGAEPIRAAALQRFAAVFSPSGFDPKSFFPCYGLAESTLFVSGGPRGIGHRTHAPRRDDGTTEPREFVSCGPPGPGVTVLVVNPETHEPAEAHEVGEIWVSGASVAAGYWGQAAESETTFRAQLARDPHRTFLRTGDLGFLRDGEVFVTGRIKDLIIVRGVNHYPQDIEATVERCHPRLRRGCVAALAVPDADSEQRLAIVAEVSQGEPLPVQAIGQAIVHAVAGAHELRVNDVVLIRQGTIYKTSSGKLQRRACREGLLRNQLEVVAQCSHTVGREAPARTSDV